MTATRPPVVDHFAEAMADWLASFTLPEALGAAIAEACAGGAPWAAAIGGTAVRRAGWLDTEALAWGVAMGGMAGAIEATRASLAAPPGRGAAGPARELLAADGLIAAVHEALAGLTPARLPDGLAALGPAFSTGECWLGREGAGPAWALVVPWALAPAAAEAPTGPWGDLATAWAAAFPLAADDAPALEAPGDEPADALWRHPAADGPTRAIFRAAASEAAAARSEARARA